MAPPRKPQRPSGMRAAEQPRHARRSLAAVLEDHAPWKPAEYALADATAFQALAAGTADKDQQLRALKWLIENCCRTYDLSYRPGPGGQRDTDFAEGQRSVGLQVVKLVKLNVGMLRRSEPLGDSHEPKS